MNHRTPIALHLIQALVQREDMDPHCVEDIITLAFDYADRIIEKDLGINESEPHEQQGDDL